MVHAEDKRHQQMVRRLVMSMLKRGCPPEQISISGLQNPDLETWAAGKGVIFDKAQKVDILGPGGYD